VTDPVPYEPAENIPPIVVWRQAGSVVSPGPFNVVEVLQTGDPPALPTSVPFTVPIIEYNLDDTVEYRVFVDVSATIAGIEYQGQVAPSGKRQRDVAFSLSTQTGPFANAETRCHKVMLVISDRSWKSGGRVFYEVPEDAGGEPVTTPAFVQWLVWVDDGTGDPRTGIGACAGQTFPE